MDSPSAFSSSDFSPSDIRPDSREGIPPRPRLPSPNLFRNFFSPESNVSGTRQAANLPPINYQETLRDVRSALQSADMAVRNAQEAFRTGRSSSSRHNVVDLTGSPPQNMHEDLFVSNTTHPHDSFRGRSAIRNAANPMHEPVYGHQPSTLSGRTRMGRSTNPHEAVFGPWNSAALGGFVAAPDFQLFLPHQPTSEVETHRQEEAAIRRQRQARRDWQRVEAHRAQQQGGAEPQQRHRQLQTSSSPPAGVSLLNQQPSSSIRNTPPRASSSESSASSPMEAVDLTQVDDDSSLAAALAKQRQDAIASQNTNSSADSAGGRTAFSAYKCAICMEPPTDATTTICGHLFCHRCITDSLKWSEQLRREDNARRNVKGLCPNCRQPLNAKDVEGNGRGLVPLEIKMVSKSMFNKGKGKAKSVEDVVEIKDDSAEKENQALGKKRKREESIDAALFDEFLEDEK